MILIIAGSRGFPRDQVLAALEACPFPVTEVVSGAARGPDTYGAEWAHKHRVPVRYVHAAWQEHGRAAGPIRNAQMVDYAAAVEESALVAFWDGQSRGTADVMERARRAGLPILVVYPKDASGGQTTTSVPKLGGPGGGCDVNRATHLLGDNQPNGAEGPLQEDSMGRPENTMTTNDSICTPRSIWEPVVRALGPIEFDPASNPSSTVPAAAQVYLPSFSTDPEPQLGVWRSTPDFDYVYGDGLSFSWRGVGLTWLNGPYSQLPDREGRPSWWGKFIEEVDEGVHFFPVRTACEWWQTYVPQVTVLTFLRKRVVHDNNFTTKATKTRAVGELITDAAAFSQALAYVGPRAHLWIPEAEKLGWTLHLNGNRRFQ